MALTDYKLTDAQIAGKGVVAAPDKLTGTAAENKALFDRLIREAVKNDLNGLIDALVAAGVGSEVLLPAGAGMKYIRLNSDRVLETSEDGSTWQATGSSGHVVVDPEGTVLPQRSRLKFAEGSVEDADGVTVVHGVQGPAGPNSVSSSTATTLTGVLAGDGNTVTTKAVDTAPVTGSANLITSGAVAQTEAELAGGMAILANGNTHVSIQKDQYVYVRGHDTLAEGLYRATENIANGGQLSGSNLTAASQGGLNDLLYRQTQRVQTYPLTILATDYITSIGNWKCARVGKIVQLQVSGNIAATPAGALDLVKGMPEPQQSMSFVVTSSAGTITLALNSTNGVIAVKKNGTNATPAGYYSGTLTYIAAD